VIYQGCSPLYYEKASEEKKNAIRAKYSLPRNYMLYVGTIEERKNLLQLVKAKHDCNIELPLVAVGRPTPYYEKVSAYIAENNVKEIYFLQGLDQIELPAIYQMAELFVYPSSFEGFGIPILEALNSGTPVITGRGGCLHETGGPDSLYVNPLEPKEIAESIMKILSNKELTNKMIAAGYEHALLFREERTAGEMMKLYRSVV
jgi:glycosyltransferase involved in cell wall biosynthesis